MPSDNPSRRRRALTLALAVVLGASIAPVGGVDADHGPAPAVAMAQLSRFALESIDSVPLPVRSTVAPPAAVFREVGLDGATALSAEPAPVMAPTLTARETIAAGCPDLTDAELLRDGASADGFGLCVRSVHEARTDASAAAIVEGFGLLGLPYSRGRRGSDGYDDCSSFVGRSYREAGRPLSNSDWEPSSSVMRNASWARVVDEPLPGDILWRRGHVAMALADGYQMHASQSGDVTHVRRAGRYSKVLAVDIVA